MNDTLNNIYLIKALDSYPHYLEEVVESLKYALSYDENNADVHCLMAQLYMEQFNDFEAAQHHIEEALAYNIDHVKSYQVFIRLCIQLNEFDKAEKLIDFAATIKGFSQVVVYEQKATIQEKQGNVKTAKKLLKQAIAYCICNEELYNLKEHLKRLEYKLNLAKPKAKKKGKKDKKKNAKKK